MRALFVVLMLAAVAGCAPMPTSEQISAADYGAPIEQDIAESMTRTMFGIYLKDPQSARYSFGRVYRGYVVTSAFEGRRLLAGYVLDVGVNAKNSFGGYVGEKPYKLLFHDGKLINAWEIGDSSGMLIKIY